MIDQYEDLTLGQIETGGPPMRPGASAQAALEQAMRSWTRRGYHVTYRDEYLAQLARRTLPDWVVVALGAIIGGLLAALISSLLTIRRRRWSVVTLAATPEGRIIVHRQRALHFPER